MSSAALFDLARQGVLLPGAGGRHPLEDAEQAHRDIESRGVEGRLRPAP